MMTIFSFASSSLILHRPALGATDGSKRAITEFCPQGCSNSEMVILTLLFALAICPRSISSESQASTSAKTHLSDVSQQECLRFLPDAGAVVPRVKPRESGEERLHLGDGDVVEEGLEEAGAVAQLIGERLCGVRISNSPSCSRQQGSAPFACVWKKTSSSVTSTNRFPSNTSSAFSPSVISIGSAPSASETSRFSGRLAMWEAREARWGAGRLSADREGRKADAGEAEGVLKATWSARGAAATKVAKRGINSDDLILNS